MLISIIVCFLSTFALLFCFLFASLDQWSLPVKLKTTLVLALFWTMKLNHSLLKRYLWTCVLSLLNCRLQIIFLAAEWNYWIWCGRCIQQIAWRGSNRTCKHHHPTEFIHHPSATHPPFNWKNDSQTFVLGLKMVNSMKLKTFRHIPATF